MGEITAEAIEQMRTPEAIEQMRRIQAETAQVAVPTESDTLVLAASVERAGLEIGRGLEAVAGAITGLVGWGDDPSTLVITLRQSAEVLGDEYQRRRRRTAHPAEVAMTHAEMAMKGWLHDARAENQRLVAQNQKLKLRLANVQKLLARERAPHKPTPVVCGLTDDSTLQLPFGD